MKRFFQLPLIVASISLLIVSCLLSIVPDEAAAMQPDETDETLLSRLDSGIEAAVSFKYGNPSDPLVNDLEVIIYHLPAGSPLRPVMEKKLLDALDKATPDGRAVLCMQLYVIGTDQSVPVLEKWLTDPETSRFAIYALGRNESPLVAAALHGKLGGVSGSLQVGIIDALGRRRVQKATADLAALTKSTDPQIVFAAVRALGNLGSQEAVQALQTVKDVPAEVLLEVDNSLLLCAESLTRDGNTQAALAIYEAFYKQDGNPQLRRAGLRGLVLTQPEKALPILATAIKNGDADFGHYAISLLNETASADALKTFASLLSEVPDPIKVLLLRAMADRQDAIVQDAVLACLAGSSDAAVRTAALATLGQVGTGEALPALLDCCASGADPEKAVALTSLVGLRGDDVDSRLCKEFSRQEAKSPVRVAAIQALARRNARSANGQLVEFVREQDDAVRAAVISSLGSLASDRECPALLSQLSDPVKASDAEAISDACRRSLMRLEDAQVSGKLVLDALKSAPAGSRPALLSLLVYSGSEEALQTVQTAARDGDEQLSLAAVKTLANWPNAAPTEVMVKIFQSGKTGETRKIALQGCIRLANLSDKPAAVYQRILKEVSDVDDQKRILQGMGDSCDTAEMLMLALTYMEKYPAIRPNAGLAAVHIANRVRAKDESLAKASLQRVVREVNHADVKQRALNVLNDIDKQEGHIFEWLIAGPYKEKGKEGEAIYNTPFGPETDESDEVEWKAIRSGQKEWSIDLEQALAQTITALPI